MDKRILIQYASLKKETQDLEQLIEETQNKIDKYGKLIVSDTVKGTRPDGTYGPIKITGLERKSTARQQALLKERLIRLNHMKEKLLKMTLEAEEYIETIQDSSLRRIVRYRCIDEMNWRKVSVRMGRKYTADSCRMAFKRFMENEE